MPEPQSLVPAAGREIALDRFAHTTYTVTRPFFSFLGRKYRVTAPDGSLVAFVKHPLLKLREQFTIYTDETETHPLLQLVSRQIVALNRAIDVFDAASGQKVGTIRNRGLKSTIRDTWDILDPNDQPVGIMVEEGAAFLRRILRFLPGRHKIELGGQRVANLRQPFRFFVKELDLDLSPGAGKIDPRFAIACSVLALMAEARREERN